MIGKTEKSIFSNWKKKSGKSGKLKIFQLEKKIGKIGKKSLVFTMADEEDVVDFLRSVGIRYVNLTKFFLGLSTHHPVAEELNSLKLCRSCLLRTWTS